MARRHSDQFAVMIFEALAAEQCDIHDMIDRAKAHGVDVDPAELLVALREAQSVMAAAAGVERQH